MVLTWVEVAEIGCGYGGQTLVNDQLLNVKSAGLFDLPFVNKLIDRYLNAHLLKGAYYTTVINKEIPQNYDLVISNYAFSELPKKLQLTYNEGVTILMVEQNAAKALNAASSAYVLELGAIKASGSAKKLLIDDGIKKTYLGL